MITPDHGHWRSSNSEPEQTIQPPNSDVTGLSSTLNVAVVGTGSVGSRHLRVLKHLAGFRPIAVPKRPERRCQLDAEGYATASSLEEAVDQGATLCVVASDTAQHLGDCLKALDLGLPTLVEKPLAVDLFEGAQMVRGAAEAGCQLFVGCVMRFSDSLNTFRRLLPEAGKLHSVRIECQSYLPDWRPQRSYLESYAARPREGGVLLDLIHEIDYAGWIFGWPENVQARIRNLGRLGIVEDEAVELSLETSTPLVVSINLDYLSRPARRVMRAYGSLGTIEWDGLAGKASLHVDQSVMQEIVSGQSRDDTFAAQAYAFANAVRSRQDARLATGEEGLKALAVCDAARRASANRREEKVIH